MPTQKKRGKNVATDVEERLVEQDVFDAENRAEDMLEEKKDAEPTGIIKVDLNEQAREILNKAKDKGVEHSFMFITTFKRYQETIIHLADLEKAIKEHGTTVEKEYVKGRKNLYVNPAIAAYNQTARAADTTAQLLLKYIVQPLSGGGETGDEFDSFKGNLMP